MHLTTEQVAAELGVSVRRVQALIRSGRLQAERPAGRRTWRIPAHALAAVRVRINGRPKQIA